MKGKILISKSHVPQQQRWKPNMFKLLAASSTTAVWRASQERCNVRAVAAFPHHRLSPSSLILWRKWAILLQLLHALPPGGLLTWPCWSSSLLVSLTFSKDTICFNSCSPVNGESGCTYNLKNTRKRPVCGKKFLPLGLCLCMRLKSL